MHLNALDKKNRHILSTHFSQHACHGVGVCCLDKNNNGLPLNDFRSYTNYYLKKSTVGPRKKHHVVFNLPPHEGVPPR